MIGPSSMFAWWPLSFTPRYEASQEGGRGGRDPHDSASRLARPQCPRSQPMNGGTSTSCRRLPKQNPCMQLIEPSALVSSEAFAYFNHHGQRLLSLATHGLVCLSGGVLAYLCPLFSQFSPVHPSSCVNSEGEEEERRKEGGEKVPIGFIFWRERREQSWGESVSPTPSPSLSAEATVIVSRQMLKGKGQDVPWALHLDFHSSVPCILPLVDKETAT